MVGNKLIILFLFIVQIGNSQKLITAAQFGVHNNDNGQFLNNTENLQKYIDWCYINQKIAIIPEGRYFVEQIVIPSGIWLKGEWVDKEFGVTSDEKSHGTTLVQLQGTNKSMFVFDTKDRSGDRVVGRISDLTLISNLVDTTGHGIAFQDTLGNDLSTDNRMIIEDVRIRRFPENGIHLNNGIATDLTIRRVDSHSNGGYGIYLNFIVSGQNTSIRDTEFTGNGMAAIFLGATNSNLTEFGNIIIDNIKTEYSNFSRDNSIQELNGIHIGKLSNTFLSITGMTVATAAPNSSGGELNAGSAIVILNEGQSLSEIPSIFWSGVGLEVGNGRTGAVGHVIEDKRTNVNIDYTRSSGFYSANGSQSFYLNTPSN